VPLGTVHGQGGRAGEELHAAAERVASVLGAARPAEHLHRFEDLRVHQVQERVDPAARGGGGVALAVHEHAHLVAGEPAHEHAGDGRARALEVQPDLLAGDLGQHDLGPRADRVEADHVDRLRNRIHALDAARVGRDGHLLGDIRRLQRDLHGHRLGSDGKGNAPRR
jgi:hypothetical protein